MKTNSLIVIAFMSVLLLGGCSKSSEMKHYARLVEYWQGREIKLPDVMTDVLTGDTIDLSGADFTILTYVDSAGCTGCKMKLPIWNEFLNVIDSVSNGTINMLMVIHTNKIEDIKYLFEQNEYNYPVYVDESNDIKIGNDFPDESMFNTFLLDNSNHVLAVGNPAYNDAVAQLYESIISGEKTISSGNSMITIRPNQIDLGRIHLGEKIVHDFSISNVGDDTVYIRKILTSCDCTSVAILSDFILPKSDVSATVIFKDDSILGEFDRTVHIFYNGFEYPSIIQITGFVEIR